MKAIQLWRDMSCGAMVAQPGNACRMCTREVWL